MYKHIQNNLINTNTAQSLHFHLFVLWTWLLRKQKQFYLLLCNIFRRVKLDSASTSTHFLLILILILILILLLLWSQSDVCITPTANSEALPGWSQPVTRLSITLHYTPYASSPKKLLSIIKWFIPIFLSLFFTWIYDNFQ